MSSPRTNLYDFSLEVKKVLDMQQAYFRTKYNKSMGEVMLRDVKKAEKQLLGLINMINLDRVEVNQASLFEPVHTMPGKRGLTTPAELAALYGKLVSIEWLNNDGTDWIPTEGKVNATTIKHAEMERVRNLSPLSPEGLLPHVGGMEGGNHG